MNLCTQIFELLFLFPCAAVLPLSSFRVSKSTNHAVANASDPRREVAAFHCMEARTAQQRIPPRLHFLPYKFQHPSVSRQLLRERHSFYFLT